MTASRLEVIYFVIHFTTMYIWHIQVNHACPGHARRKCKSCTCAIVVSAVCITKEVYMIYVYIHLPRLCNSALTPVDVIREGGGRKALNVDQCGFGYPALPPQ